MVIQYIFSEGEVIAMNTKKDETPDIKNDPYGCDTPSTHRIQASSAMDCTGLIPALPADDAELENYAELYPFPGDILHKE